MGATAEALFVVTARTRGLLTFRFADRVNFQHLTTGRLREDGLMDAAKKSDAFQFLATEFRRGQVRAGVRRRKQQQQNHQPAMYRALLHQVLLAEYRIAPSSLTRAILAVNFYAIVFARAFLFAACL